MVKQGRPRKDDPPVEDMVGVTVRLEKAVYERLRFMSFEKRETQQSIIRRGIELALKAAKY